MRIQRARWTTAAGWQPRLETFDRDADLIFAFAGPEIGNRAELLSSVAQTFEGGTLIGCSTAGEIVQGQVLENSLTITAVKFEKARVKAVSTPCATQESSFSVGQTLGGLLAKEPGLRHVFVLSDGLVVNGSKLVEGLKATLPSDVTLSGGLAGDNAKFKSTFVIHGETARSQTILAVGFFGDDLEIEFGSFGGWDSFGPTRKVTRAEGNTVFELDGKPVLDLYRQYLGDHAAGLPASGLLFPLSIKTETSPNTLVRTVLGIDEETKSMVFAGDVPLGATVQLMKANFDRLIDGASGAAKACLHRNPDSRPELAILISCVGRKLVLSQRIEEEIEAVGEIFGDDTVLVGFYSYGEICTSPLNMHTDLHNQTMTITSFRER